RRIRTLSRGLLIWQSRLALAESMLHGHREGHQQRHGEECANGAPEPSAESDGKKHGEGIDLETPPHKRRCYELAFDYDESQIQQRSHRRFPQARVQEKANHAKSADYHGRPNIWNVVEHCR